jgi:hypothetical protein
MKPARVPLKPAHPDRICWGCDKYCPADDLACGNGTIRTLHPIELFGRTGSSGPKQTRQPPRPM